MVGRGAIVARQGEPGNFGQGPRVFRHRVREDIRALAAGRPPVQPATSAPLPSRPTWSGDNVLRIPAREGDDDSALRAATMEKAGIYRDDERLRGEARRFH